MSLLPTADPPGCSDWAPRGPSLPLPRQRSGTGRRALADALAGPGAAARARWRVAHLLAMGCLLGQMGGVLALDLNTATEAELDGLSGVGPAFTARVMQARAERPFQDWADFIRRVKGVQERTAWRLSQQGARIQQAPLAVPHHPPLTAPHARVSRD